ncbi:hypothetical protein PR202_gb24142 [Eleusine coracana subsp. coracana]|uniref:Protein kinase domain-containing protein n=1 Tax=Eleusine coracana subsp. coracana TaxID=191504 RepID=A0AAV5FKG6_ELECO|nr:hypothetical protein PR202_gb24142 [Eleusine coracana subsp. coracana]
MKYHVPLISSVLLLWLSAVCMLAAAEVPPGGCQQERCGNVEIPYPFGITGSKCALDDSFTIDCKVVGGDDAKAEQRQVSLLQDSQNNHTVFRFSYMDNKIFIIGCDILAIFVGGDMIAHQVAEALTYLHNWAFPPILHGDVKSDNILMDHNYTVKISDFGSSTLAPSNEAQFMSRVQGTFGYLDPEYMQTGRLTAKSDVYSFGVVILELLTRKKPLNLQRPEDEDTIVGKFMFGTDEQRISYMDDQIKSDSNMMIINDISDLVKQCLDLSGSKRPLMKDVANNLHMLLKRAQGEEASTSSGAQHNLEEEDQFLDQMRRNNSAASQEGGLVSPTPIEEYDIVVSTAGMDAANKKHKKTPATYATLRRTIKAKKGRDGFEPPSAEGPTMRSKKARSATASTPANEMESWHGTLRHPSCRGDGELLLAKSSDHHQQVEGSSSLNNQPVFHG